MNILILADMEGCIDVYEENSRELNLSLMQKEVKILLECLSKNDKYDITVIDCHDNGKNLDLLAPFFPKIKFYNHIWGFDEAMRLEKCTVRR